LCNCIVLLKWEKDGCLVKTFLAKTLGKNAKVGKSTPGYMKREEKMRLTEVKLQVEDVPCVGYGLTR